jgi:hypothetical protein
VILDQLEHRSGKTFTKRPRSVRTGAVLRIQQRCPELVLHRLGHRPEILLARPDEVQRLPTFSVLDHYSRVAIEIASSDRDSTVSVGVTIAVRIVWFAAGKIIR